MKFLKPLPLPLELGLYAAALGCLFLVPLLGPVMCEGLLNGATRAGWIGVRRGAGR
jgi:hypothetical protein